MTFVIREFEEKRIFLAAEPDQPRFRDEFRQRESNESAALRWLMDLLRAPHARPRLTSPRALDDPAKNCVQTIYESSRRVRRDETKGRVPRTRLKLWLTLIIKFHRLEFRERDSCDHKGHLQHASWSKRCFTSWSSAGSGKTKAHDGADLRTIINFRNSVIRINDWTR